MVCFFPPLCWLENGDNWSDLEHVSQAVEPLAGSRLPCGKVMNFILCISDSALVSFVIAAN